MPFVPFAMERWQSTYEHHVASNLSESGVEPLTVAELLALAGHAPETVTSGLLEYIQSNGSKELRERIAAFHPGATPGEVVVTTGSAEANFISTWELCGDGGEIVFMEPNYFQIHGVAESFGAPVREWWLERGSWRADTAALQELANERTRLIVVTSPNNPTGVRFDEGFVDAVLAAADRVGAWVLADEVYRGAEREGPESPTFWAPGRKVIVTGGLSKAYGLPGLRVGWAVTEPEMASRLWARKDYTTISVSSISQTLATLALEPGVRRALLDRTRSILRSNWAILEEWLQERSDVFTWRAPDAGAIAMVDYDLPDDSLALVERVRREADCLLVPGDHFRLPGSLRIGFGPHEEVLRDGLARLGRVVDPLREPAGQAKGD